MALRVPGQSNYDYNTRDKKTSNGTNTDNSAATLQKNIYAALHGKKDPNSIVDGTIDNLGIKNKTVARVSKMTAHMLFALYEKGRDKQEAQNAIQKGTTNQKQMESKSDAIEGQADATFEQTNNDINNETDNIETNNEDITTKNEENENLSKENDEHSQTIQENNQKSEQLQEQRNNLVEQIQRKKATVSLPDTMPKQAPKSKPVSTPNVINIPNSGTNNNVSAPQDNIETNQVENLSNDGNTSSEVQDLINQANELGVQINDLNTQNTDLQTTITTNNETVSTNIETIQDDATNIENASTSITNLYSQADAAIKNFDGLLKDELKSFTTDQLLDAVEQLTLSAINGTEGGIFAAAATAMGASSIVTFGSTAAEAAKYAEASADKFSSVPKRVAAQVAIKLATGMAQTYTQQAISQMSNLVGVDLSSIYSNAMQVYNTAMSTANNALGGQTSNNNVDTTSTNTNSTQNQNQNQKTPQTDDNQNKKQMA